MSLRAASIHDWTRRRAVVPVQARRAGLRETGVQEGRAAIARGVVNDGHLVARVGGQRVQNRRRAFFEKITSIPIRWYDGSRGMSG